MNGAAPGASKGRAATAMRAIAAILSSLILQIPPTAREAGGNDGLRDSQIAQGIRDVAHAHFKAGRRGKAIEILSAAAAESPSDPGLWFDLGTALLADGDYDRARDSFRKTLLCDPSHADACLNLGVFALRDNDLDGAEAMFKKAIAAKPGWPQARANIAGVHAKRGKTAEAIREYRAVLESEPGLAVARFNLAKCLERNKEWEAAAAEYREILKRDPGAYRAHVELASIYRTRLNRPEKALYHYYKVVEALKPCPVTEAAKKAIEEIGKGQGP